MLTVILALALGQPILPPVPRYDRDLEAATAAGKPLVAFVGVPMRRIDGAAVTQAPSGKFKSEGYPASCVIVSDASGKWRATLPATATDDQIGRAVRGEVGRSAAPFVPSRSSTDRSSQAPAAPDVSPSASVDALDMVNAQRAKRGLRPYLPDAGLQQAARAAAEYRGARLIFGHVNDFKFVPAGTHCTTAGCAGNEPSWGFMACDLYANHTHCGAAYVMGRDGKMYCHAFYR